MSDLSQKLGIVVYVEDQATGKLQRVKAEVQGLGPAASRAGAGVAAGMGKLNAGIAQAKKGVGEIGRGLAAGAVNLAKFGMVAGTAAVGGVVALAKAAGDFQAKLNVINTIAQVSPGDLARIGNGIRKLSVRGGADLGDLSSAYYDLLSAGIKVADAQRYLDLSFKLSRGSLSTTGEAVDFLTTAVNAYGLDQRGATVAADQFAQAVADGKVKLSEISATFSDVASVAKTAGIGLDEIAASYGQLTAQGVPAGEVTTEMNRAIIELLKPGKDLLALQKKMKTDYADLAREKGLVAALQQMRDDAASAKIPFQDLFGRLEGYKYALQTTGPANAAFNAELRRIRGSAGELDAQFKQRAQGLQFQVGRLRSVLLSLAITAGNEILPRLTPVVESIADRLAAPETAAAVERVGRELGKWVGEAFSSKNIDAATRLAQDVLPSVIDGMRTAASLARDAVGLFNSLPDGLKQAAVAALVINKGTNGLVARGVGDVVGGLVRAGGIGALGGMLPGRAGTVLGALGGRGTPVWVTNWPAGGIGGGGGLPGVVPAAAAGGMAGLGTLAAGIGGILAAYWLPQLLANENGVGAQGASVTGSQGQSLGSLTWQQVGMGGPNLANQLAAQGNTGQGATRDRGHEVDSGQTGIYGPGTRDRGYQIDNASRQSWKSIGAEVGGVIARPLDALHRDFLVQIGILRKTADPHAMAAAAAKAAAAVEKGVGGVEGTKALLATLQKDRKAVAASGDKADLARIDAAIRIVAGKIPGREHVERQIAKAEEIARSSQSTDRKIAGLQSIERDLRGHSRVAAQRVATLITTLRNKKMSVSVTVGGTVVNIAGLAGSRATTRISTGRWSGKAVPFAEGGDYPAGRPRVVGERGPELDVPTGPGTIFTRDQTRRLRDLVRDGGDRGGGGNLAAAVARLEAAIRGMGFAVTSPVSYRDVDRAAVRRGRIGPTGMALGRI